MRRRATWERSWSKFLQPAALASLAVMLLALAGCSPPMTQKPNESNSDYRQRQNLELYFRRWDVWPGQVTYTGLYVIERVLDLPPSRWDTLDKPPEPTGDAYGKICKTMPGIRPAQESDVDRLHCLRIGAGKKLNGCKQRGHHGRRCVDFATAPGLMTDPETRRRLSIVALAPCRTFSHFRRPEPSPSGLPYNDLTNNLQHLEAVFVCNRDKNDGIWIFRLAFTDISSGKVFLFPEDFGGKVVE